MKRKKLALLATTGVAFAFGIIGSVIAVKAEANPEFTLEDELLSTYSVGQTLSVPDATFTVDGTEIEAETVLVAPDGHAYRVGDTVELDAPGEYELEYRAYVNGELIVERKYFAVKNMKYTFSGEQNSTFVYGLDTSAYETGITGLRTAIGMDSTFHYNEIFNVNGLSANEPIIELFTLPKIQGNYDARIIIVRLTDVYDDNNYVEVAFRRYASLDPWAENVTYLSASTAGQNYVGIEGSEVHTESTYAGLPIYVSMIGSIPNGKVGDQSMGFYLSGMDVIATVNGNAYGTVCSLDNPSYFSHTWKGFTTGEVTMSVRAAEYNVSSEMNLMITKLGGKTVEENGELIDTAPPVITLDMQGEDSAVTAVVGKAYPLYPATAYDLYAKNCTVTTRVYGSYGTTNAYDITVLNGCFVPNRVGAYTIEYTAKDAYGNTAVKTLRVNAVAQENDIEIQFGDKVTTGSVGTYIPVAKVDTYGGHGQKTVSASVKLDSNAYELKNGCFYPEEAGTYMVTYTVTDRLGFVKTDGYAVTVAAATAPIFTEEPVLPDYFIIGGQYALPKLYATDYNDNKKQVLANVKITDSIGEHDYDTTEYYTVPEDTQTVKIVYTAGGALKTYTKNVVDVKNSEGRLDLTKYFVTNNLSLMPQARYTDFTTTAESGTARFINALYADGFLAEFRVDKATAGGLKKITFELADVQTGETLTLGFDGKSMIVDGVAAALSPTANFSNGALFSFRYRTNRTIELDTAGTVRISDYSDFEGFASGKVNLTITVEGNVGTFQLETINNQRFNTADADNIRPEIILENVIIPVAELGETVTVSKALILDVLNPLVQGSITVSFGKTYVTSIDGVQLQKQSVNRDWQFIANEYGDYIVSYEATDGAGRTQRYNYIVTVLDSGNPEITVNGSIVSSVNIGETIQLPTATVTDDVDSEIECRVYVFGPDYSVRFVNGSFKPNKKGNYRVCYTAVDGAGNISIVEFTVEVK